jgi:hypothetical protein
MDTFILVFPSFFFCQRAGSPMKNKMKAADEGVCAVEWSGTSWQQGNVGDVTPFPESAK